MKTLAEYSFNGCTKLTDVNIDQALYDKYGAGAFKNCSHYVNHPLDYATLGEKAIVGDYQYKVTDASRNGYGTCMLISVVNPVAAVVIPNYVEIKDCTYKVTRIYSTSFQKNTTMTSLVIGGNVKTIDASAFLGCSSLVKVTGGANVQTIGNKAFTNCFALKTFSIGSSSLKKIGNYAFYGDKVLTTIYIQKTTKLTKPGVKNSLKGSSVKTVKVKKSKLKKYKKIFKKKNSGRKVKVK